jgi:hypothetical protein
VVLLLYLSEEALVVPVAQVGLVDLVDQRPPHSALALALGLALVLELVLPSAPLFLALVPVLAQVQGCPDRSSSRARSVSNQPSIRWL